MGKRKSSLKLVLVSTVWQLQQLRPSLTWNVPSIWVREDVKRQALNVFRMELLGAKVEAVTDGSRVLKDAVNTALRSWVANIDDTHYILGSALGPHPFPEIVRDFQSVIGREAKQQYRDLTGQDLPDALVACVGGGSNAIGLFHPFVEDESVAMYGAEAAGLGVDTEHHAATLTKGRPGVLHGSLMDVLQDAHGQILEAFSISAGLDYPGIGPEHSPPTISNVPAMFL